MKHKRRGDIKIEKAEFLNNPIVRQILYALMYGGATLGGVKGIEQIGPAPSQACPTIPACPACPACPSIVIQPRVHRGDRP